LVFLMEHSYFVYILASKRNGTTYVGLTNELAKRISEHKSGCADSFTKKYNVKNLVYFESYSSVQEARHRELCLKRWKRARKLELIEGMNPAWDDLSLSLSK